MKKNRGTQKNLLIKFFIIPLVLLSLWVGLTFWYIIKSDTSLSVLSYVHGNESFEAVVYDPLLKGDKISGTFTAQEDNLGIVSVKFRTSIRPAYKDEDVLMFRLKEVGSHEWYYQNKYKVGLIYDVSFFPFGFPKISDSKGKKYYFEIESLNGNIHNSVSLSDRGYVLFSRYQEDKNILVSDRKELLLFAVKKFSYALRIIDTWFATFIYLLPFLFYLLWISPFWQFQKKRMEEIIVKVSRSNFHILLLGVVAIDIFIIQLRNDVMYFVIPFLWIAAFHMNNKNKQMTFFVALGFLLIASIFLLFDDAQTAEKGAAWAYVFMAAGLIQILYEMKREKRQRKRAILRK